jgi:hypothetical protein
MLDNFYGPGNTAYHFYKRPFDAEPAELLGRVVVGMDSLNELSKSKKSDREFYAFTL